MNQSNKDILDYIWIEKFRKIENQGFHFTNKYKYSYDNESNKLTRKENPEYVDDFFGENVEINAIVGMNGAGKTSLLTALMSCFSADPSSVGDDGYIDFSKSNIVLAFRSGIVYYIYDTIGDNGRIQKGVYIQSVEGVDITDKHYSQQLDMHCLFHNNVLDYQTFDSPFTNGCNTNISTSALMHEYSNDDTENNPVKTYFFREFEKQLDPLNYIEKGNNKLILEGLKWPEYATIYIKQIKDIGNELDYLYNSINLNRSKYAVDFYDNFFGIFNKLICFEGNVLEQFKAKISPGIIATILLRALSKIILNNENVFMHAYVLVCIAISCFGKAANAERLKKLTKPNLAWDMVIEILNHLRNENNKVDILENFKNSKYCNKEIKKYNETIGDLYDKCFDYLSDAAEFVFDFVNPIDKYNGREKDIDATIDTFRIYLSSPKEYCENFLDIKLLDFWNKYKPIGLIGELLEFSWNLSSGEQARLELFARIFHYYECNILYSPKQDINNLLILLDEADMLLHPEWQRTFVKDIKEFAENLFSKHNIHVQIMIATHSPIMLSDIPKQNVLYLKNIFDEEKNNQPETFGSNIFKLYNNAFFMDEGAIGAFAKEKLEILLKDIIDRNGDKNDIQKRINLIGDDFLRSKFQAQFESLYNTDLDSEIAALEKKLAELNQRRAEIIKVNKPNEECEGYND